MKTAGNFSHTMAFGNSSMICHFRNITYRWNTQLHAVHHGTLLQSI